MTGHVDGMEAQKVLQAFQRETGLRDLGYEIRPRNDGDYLLIHIGNPTDRYFSLLGRALDALPDDNEFKSRTTLKRKAQSPWLLSSESRLLQRVLSESLTVDRHTFGAEFFTRYIPSVFGGEEQIVAAGNHVVFGRRGSGKSSLLLYAMRTLEKESRPFAWVNMQTYEKRTDLAVIVDVIREILAQATDVAGLVADDLLRKADDLLRAPEAITAEIIRFLLPSLRRAFEGLTKKHGGFTVFLDDLHVIGSELQPELLGSLYAFARGNRVFLKVSGIEAFTRTWDPSGRHGLEMPNDAQAIRLDYNLTMPDKSREHIGKILDSHAVYCALPSVNVLCNKHTLNRLVWVAAGVPRDAINIFTQAMILAATRNQRSITATSINTAASAASEDKLRFVRMDAADEEQELLRVLGEIKDFCIREEKKNAFLVEMRHEDPVFGAIRKLIELRFLHVLHGGLTPDRAGERFMALMLDYGFYTGMRAAKSVDLFQKEPRTPQAKELRGLPRFRSRQQQSQPR